MDSISLTPNYSALFAQFLKDGRTQALNLRQRLPYDSAQTAEILRALQAPLASLNIALCSITSTTELEQLREVMAEFVRYVDSTAAQLEYEEPDEPECTCHERSWYGDHHDTECPLALKPH